MSWTAISELPRAIVVGMPDRTQSLGKHSAAIWHNSSNSTDNFPKISFHKRTPPSIVLSEFDPNELDEKQWLNIGFSKSQVKTILKYKEVIGGSFSSKEQFRKCYAVSAEKFEQLKKYILLPETSQRNFKTFNNNKKEIKINRRFNPDLLTQEDWEKIGFSEKQAQAIIKYKMYLGGSFRSKEKFSECFIISSEHYKKLSPYLILPDKTPENFNFISKKDKEKTKIFYSYFDPNELNEEDWQKLGFSEKQVNVILNYKIKILKGSFKSLEDVQKCIVINEEKFNEIKPYIKFKENFNPIQNASQKPSIVHTNFKEIDLNKITFKQLLEFGFEEKQAASFIGFRNKLGGFVIKKQISEAYNITEELAEKITETCFLNNTSTQKYNLMDAPEEWLKTHPYFRYHADKIIFYRTCYENQREVWKKLKLKPDDEYKMKLYILE